MKNGEKRPDEGLADLERGSLAAQEPCCLPEPTGSVIPAHFLPSRTRRNIRPFGLGCMPAQQEIRDTMVINNTAMIHYEPENNIIRDLRELYEKVKKCLFT